MSDIIDELNNLSDDVRCGTWKTEEVKRAVLLGIQLSMETVRQVENAKKEG